MTQQEHLNRIRARCVELLEIAEKRTAGPWSVYFDERDVEFGDDQSEPSITDNDGCQIAVGFNNDEQNNDDFKFIASCAGAAEAGWKATIVAIDSIFNPPSSQTTHNWIAIYEKETVERIIAFWPAELL